MKNLIILLIAAAGLSNLQAQSRVKEAWVRQYDSGSFGNADAVFDIASDDAGNVYVAGTSYYPDTGQDIVTVKYNSAGVKQWSTRYNGSGNNNDEARALVVDQNGNVYVTGWIIIPQLIAQLVIIKYNTAGVQQWAVTYASPDNYLALGLDLAIDKSANVYVVGRSHGLSGTTDYTTIKYDRNGIRRWVKWYDGPSHDDDVAAQVVIDHTGNVYITGSSANAPSTTAYDYATVKYDSNGVELWQARYDGPNKSNDMANAIAVDSAGNVYVTGSSDNLGDNLNRHTDGVTVKYNPNGVEQWIARYNGPNNSYDFFSAIAIDKSGHIFITGGSRDSRTSPTYSITARYNPAGIRQWLTEEKDPAKLGSRGQQIALDDNGNVYTLVWVTTAAPDKFIVTQYDANGKKKWESASQPGVAKAMCIDKNGNIYLTGDSNNDFLVTKYSQQGNRLWTAAFNGSSNSQDRAIGMTVDHSGNVYVAAISPVPSGGQDYLIIKYTAPGDIQWTARYKSAENYANPTAIVSDDSGNVYVTGSSYSSSTLNDYTTVKYNANGVLQWAVNSGRPGMSSDTPTALAVDKDGNVYVTGKSFVSGIGTYYVTIKHDRTGLKKWHVEYFLPRDHIGNNANEEPSLALDGSGNVYVAGSQFISGNGYDYVLAKYGSTGDRRWIATYGGSDYDGATAIITDRSGNVYLTGEGGTLKYDPNGTLIGLAPSPGRAVDLALNASGNLAAVGTNFDGSLADYITYQYDAAGNILWTARYNGAKNSADLPRAVIIDQAGNVYVSGSSVTFGLRLDYASIKYNSAGVQQWAALYTSSSDINDEVVALGLDQNNNFYVTGTIADRPLWSAIATIKYTDATVAVAEDKITSPAHYHLAQNHPNPFNPSTTIRYALAKPGQVTLKVFNLHGQEVAMLVNENKLVGEYAVKWSPKNIPSGVYVYRLEAGEFTATKKLILLR